MHFLSRYILYAPRYQVRAYIFPSTFPARSTAGSAAPSISDRPRRVKSTRSDDVLLQPGIENSTNRSSLAEDRAAQRLGAGNEDQCFFVKSSVDFAPGNRQKLFPAADIRLGKVFPRAVARVWNPGSPSFLVKSEPRDGKSRERSDSFCLRYQRPGETVLRLTNGTSDRPCLK